MHRLVIAAAFALSAVTQAHAFELKSSTIKGGSTLPDKHVFKGFGCEGGNVSPALEWSGVPKDAKSLALTVYDPDAPTGSGWWHWTVVNIPVTATGLPEGAGSAGGKLPEGAVQGRTDFGQTGFGGACPPKGDKPHRYVFTLFALKVERIDLDSSASAAAIGFNLNANTLAKATLTGLYGR